MKARWILGMVLASALALGACGGDDDDDDGGGNFAQDDDSSAESYAAGAAPGVPASGGAPVGGTSGDEPLPQLDPGRKIIFTASMALNSGDVGKTYSEAISLANANGGYVEKSQYANDAEDNARRSASLTIRVPVQNYDGLIAKLRGLQGVTVASEGSNSNEVTEQYTDLQSRQRNLERTEQQYLELLGRATTINEILTVQDRLSGVRSQVEQIQGRLKVLDDLTDFATVNLAIAPLIAKVEDPKSGGWKLSEVFVESWASSIEVARYAAAAGVVASVAVAWLGVPAGLIYLATRRLRKRPATVTPLAEGS